MVHIAGMQLGAYAAAAIALGAVGVESPQWSVDSPQCTRSNRTSAPLYEVVTSYSPLYEPEYKRIKWCTDTLGAVWIDAPQ